MTLSNKGRYGVFGGAYLPELLMPALLDLEKSWKEAKSSAEFKEELYQLLTTFAGRPTPLTEAKTLAKAIKAPRVFLKREDLLHTGAHKINNSLGQCLLAKRRGKRRIIAETGAGQHGVATATACARLGLECVVYMGEVDRQRQKPNVDKMELLGAQVISVSSGSATLKDAINAALRDWSATFEESHYCLGSALGPHPYPEIVRDLQSIIGQETKAQMISQIGRLPDVLIACVGGGSNAIGLFAPFIEDKGVRLIGVEAGGKENQLGQHAARFHGGRPGVLHGTYTYILQDNDGQICPTHSISAGLDYPAIGPEHAHLFETGRAHYTKASDKEALEAFYLLSRTEGIIPALESSHAIGYLIREAKNFKEEIIVVNLSGRGDKDLAHIKELNNDTHG